MQALKAFVVIFGVLIVAGIAVLGVAVYRGAVNLAGEPAPTSAAPRPSAGSVWGKAGGEGSGPRRGFGTQELTLPTGSRIVERVAEGDRLILRLRLRDGGPQIVILDMASGARLGTVGFTEGAFTEGEVTRRAAGAR